MDRIDWLGLEDSIDWIHWFFCLRILFGYAKIGFLL